MSSIKDDTTKISEAIPALIKALEVYTENNKPVPIKLSTLSHHKYFWTLILALIATWGYWLNWRAEIISAQITNTEETIRYKRDIFSKLDNALTTSRALVLNQRLLCDSAQPPSPISQQIERNSSLINITATSSTLKGLIDDISYREISYFINEIYSMNDVCKLDKVKLDNQMHEQVNSINKHIGSSIEKDYAKLEILEQKDAFENLLSKIAR